MAEIRRCNRCGNPLRSDALEGTCPACMLRAGLEPDFERLPDGPAEEEVTFGFEPTLPGHVLESLARSIGSIPRVLLPDTANDDAGVAIIKPSSGEIPAPGERGDRYQLFGEIARGGMGAVLKGRDPDLGRDLAVKVLLESHQDKPELVRRFVEEAQIGGQLQHPGIVPVYELGAFADRRPYFTMKLVKGRTLSALLAERAGRGSPDPARSLTEGLPPAHDDLPRFLSIFEAIGQTMAYAHARSVIHRDLKPSNVMVGSFGEVQVMDWGLAKVLKEGGVADEPPVEPAPEKSVIATVRSGSDVDRSEAGSVLGTPAYMAPEQAAGEVERVDRRADVFGLGSILCEILTGQPAYTGRSSMEILRKAMRGDTADALARLDGCAAEAELIALARDCLAVEPEDRPRDAGLVAERIRAYLAGVQARVQEAERERAVAVARAIEERRRRKLQLGLAASVLALMTLGGLSTTYYLQQRQARATAIDRVVGQAVTLREQAVAHPDDLSRWQVALAAVEQAEAGGDASARDRLLALRTEVQAGLDAGQRDRTLLARVIDIRSAEADDGDGSATEAAYSDAFREAGIDLATLPPAEAGAKIRARPPSVALALAGAIDNWASIRRARRADAAGSVRLNEAARAADPDPWRNELRAALDQSDKAARLAGLQALAKTAKFDELGAISLNLLGSGLNDAGDSARAESVLRTAQQRHPGDVWVNYALGWVLAKLSRRDECIRFYTVARAIRPETAHELAHALQRRGDSDEALAVFRDLKGLRPGNAWHLTCLGAALKEKGLVREAGETLEAAVAAGRDAIRLKPDDARAHFHLGLALWIQGKPDDAIALYRAAIRLKPDYAIAHTNLGVVLATQGKLDGAIAEHRTAIRLKPDDAGAHSKLGSDLNAQGKYDEAVAEYRTAIRLVPDDATAHNTLGIALANQGKLDLAVAELRTAIRLKPDDAAAHNNLGNALQEQGKLDLAVALYRTAIRLKPDDAETHFNLGNTLSRQEKFDEAVAEYGTAIRLKPDFAFAHSSLGSALLRQGKLDLAIAECRTAVRLKPVDADAHGNLGDALSRQEKYDDAVAEYRTAIRLKPDFAEAHGNLGDALSRQEKYDDAVAEYRTTIRLKPDDAGPHNHLGLALRTQGKLDLAIAEFRTAIRLKPDDAEAHTNIGAILCDVKHDYPAAEAAFREAIRLKPDLSQAHTSLGNALAHQGKLDEAIAEYRTAIRLEPELAGVHLSLGLTLHAQVKLDLAIAEYRTAIRLKPDYAEAHCNVGQILQQQGDFAGALEMYRKGHELGSRRPDWSYPSAQWVAEAERKLALAKRLPAMLRGEDKPRDNAERLTFAQMAYDRKHVAVAARLWAEALASEPKLGDDRQTMPRYNAACAAALAAAGQGKDELPPDDAAKAKLRQQALDWLKTELTAWGKLLESGPPQARPAILQTVDHWKQDTDLAGVRDADGLAKLPADEQKDWRTLWADVDSTLKRAGSQR